MTVKRGYEPGFDVEFDYGKEAEHYVDDLLRQVFDGTRRIEVKHDRRSSDTGRIYVEYECRGRDGIWRKSGIATTTADVWAFVLADTGVAIFFPTSVLRYMTKQQWRIPKYRQDCMYGENPTRGVTIPLTSLPAFACEVPWNA